MYYSFRNDYSEGAHELVMEALLRSSCAQTAGYGNRMGQNICHENTIMKNGEISKIKNASVS